VNLPNLYHLKYFVDAVESGAVSRSAERNHVSHSAVSQAIQNLERQLDVSLVDHQKKYFRVTERGLALAKEGALWLGQLEKIKNTESRARPQEKFSLGLSRSLAQVYLGSLIRCFEKKLPHLNLEVRLGTTGELMEKTAAGSLDLSLSIGRQALATLDQQVVQRGNFVLIDSRKRSKPDWERFLLTEPKEETEKLRKSFYKKFGRDLKTVLEVGSWDVIAQLVHEGLGIGLVPDLALRSSQGLSIKRLKCDWFECPFEIYLNDNFRGSRKSLKKEVAQEIIAEIKRSFKD
jgi:DNA-binding transcriptional LysR family regulator